MRCRNCGNTSHQTQTCTEFGPWFPEEGKTMADYGDLGRKIYDLVAGDVIAEYKANHAGD